MPYDLNDIAEKIAASKKAGKNHFIVVVSEGIGNSQKIAEEIQEHVHIDCRATILGHVQRGGAPTLRDRVEASRMGYYAVELLVEGKSNRVVGLQHGDIVDVDIQEALKMTKEFPKDLYRIANEIAI